MTALSELDRLKTAAADAAVAMVEDGMIVGLGTGSTTWIALGLLGQRVAEGLHVIGIPTSEETQREALRLRIPLSTHRGRDQAGKAPGRPECGHYILDRTCDGIEDAEDLRRQLDETVGVVEHRLFLGIASRVIVRSSQGVRVLQRTSADPKQRVPARD